MTAHDLICHLQKLDANTPVTILLDTDGEGIDLASPAGLLLTLAGEPREFSLGLKLPADCTVLVLVASGSPEHKLLLEQL